MQTPMRLTAALSFALALTIGSFVAGASAEPKPFNLCVVHNLADHPSIAAIVNGMNDEAPLFGTRLRISTRPSIRRSRWR
jgi:ABC-type sugar transport system substrate-binding protein